MPGDTEGHGRLTVPEQAALADLRPKERECLIRYYVEGENLYEIAGALGRNSSTVSRNIHRGEARLDKAWGLCSGEGDAV